ncbi:hypothetical protein GJAV_G00105580 [Gymnothorax javanicus]|nr:hypothetical protein GJAV_G00105580 [Gymnothorax javanicus]
MEKTIVVVVSLHAELWDTRLNIYRDLVKKAQAWREIPQFGNTSCLVFTLLLATNGVHIREKKISASHSLKYFYTAVTPGIELPEFTAVGTVDDVQFMYYDSNIRRMIPKTEWINENEAADYWKRAIPILTQEQQFIYASLEIATAHFNHTQGVHTLQNIYGCEWDDVSGATERFDQYGYDGEDFITLNNEFWNFMAVVPEADFLEQKWNDHSDHLEHRKQFLIHVCVERLKKYVRYGKSSLERTVPPEVSLIQKDPSSPVTCHVTGFYPHGVMVTWQKNGQELDVDVELGETVPNGDGTFQTRSHLRVKPEDWKRDRYTCTVQHKSLEQDIILTVTEENIIAVHPQIYPEGRVQARGIIIILVVFLLIAFVIICVLICTDKTSVPPEVSLQQTDPSSPVTCHVTGFRPRGVMVTWQKKRTGAGCGRRAGGDGAQWGRNFPDQISPESEA